MPDFDRSFVLRLVEAAVAAPSADNAHHVRFRVRDDGLDVVTDTAFAEGTVPHRRSLTLLSFGAVVENLRLALQEAGWAWTPNCFPEAEDPRLLARIDRQALVPTAARDPLAAAIRGRHTNRALFRGPPVTTGERAVLEDAVASVAGISLRWFDDAASRRALLALMRRAETARFRERRHHAELFDSIAFEAGWTGTSNERIAPGSLAIERPLRPGFAVLRHWPVMRAASRLGAHHGVGMRSGDWPARFAPHRLVLAGPRTEAAALDAGAAFQRLWLAAETLGLAVQPMVGAAVLVDDEDPASPGLPTRLAESLQAGWRPLLGDLRPYVVLRLGRARPASVRSGRHPPANYLVE